MKNMKTMTVLVWIICVALSLCACGPDVKGTVGTEEEVNVSLGTVSQDIYTNEFLNLKFAPGQEWTFADEARLTELSGLTSGLLDEKYAKALEDGQTFIDLFCSRNDRKASVNINVTKLTAGELLIGVSAALENQKSQLEEQYQNSGIENAKISISEKEFLGQKEVFLTTTASISGVPYYIEQVCYRIGRYQICITSSSYVDNVTQEGLALFERLK